MISRLILALHRAYLGYKKPRKPQMSDEDVKAMASKLVNAIKVGEEEIIKPFSYHLNVASQGQPPTDVEQLKNVLKTSLNSLATEIYTLIDLTKPITVEVKTEDVGGQLYISGVLSVKFDEATPDVYDISMELLKDGFIYRAEESAFVITKKV